MKEDTNTLIFHIFEYDAESGTECSAESVVHFIWLHINFANSEN